MKSAYELAMERLAKQTPIVSLTEEQKREIAELESRYKAKLAERELAAREAIARAEAVGDDATAERARQEWLAERRKIQEELERKKETVRQSRPA